MAKQKLTYDSKTKKMVPQTTVEPAEKDGRFKVNIGETLGSKLLVCAEEDGVDMKADTPAGEKVRRTNTATMYARKAVEEFLAARNSMESAEDEPEAES